MNDVFAKRNKNVPLVTSIRKYSRSCNIDGVKDQLINLQKNVLAYMGHREKQKKLDDKLIKTILKVYEIIEKEQEKLMYDGESPLNRDSEDIKNGRPTRKRKFVNADYDSCSSQDSQEDKVMNVTSNFNKHVKINSSENSRESSPIGELEESKELNNQHTINQRELRD